MTVRLYILESRYEQSRQLVRDQKFEHVENYTSITFEDAKIEAYRYLQQAERLRQPVPVTESKLAFTVKLPRGLIQGVRLYASVKRISISEVVNRALLALLPRGRGRG